MTSAVSLSKIMKHHLKENTWLPVLSMIVQLLLGPVFMLLLEGNVVRDNAMSNNAMREIVDSIGYVLRGEHISLQIIVLYVGVVLVAIFGFQYLFSINRTDMVHSSPVKREKLFLGIYLNGFLYWFIPSLISNLLTILVTITQVGGAKGVARLIYIILINQIYLVLCFLIIYNCILVAIMISGNIFNALVNTIILGVSVIGIYNIYIFTATESFKTYISVGYKLFMRKVCTFSPLTIPVVILSELNSDYKMATPFRTIPFIMIGSVIIMVANFFLAMYLHKNRKSELSSRGTKAVVYKIVIESIISIACGLTGGLFMTEMASGGAELPWGIFGAVVFSALCLGVLRVIFNMNFKEFLGRKGRMFMVVAATVLVFLSFRFDWYGYDDYVVSPDRMVKAELAFTNGGDQCTNVVDNGDGGFYWNWSDFKYVEIKDPSIATGIMSAPKDDTYYNNYYYAMVLKVTLKNGREVYRSYNMSPEINEIIKPFVESEEYIRTYYKGTIGEFDTIERGELRDYSTEYPNGKEDFLDTEETETFMELYKQDFYDSFSVETMWDSVYTIGINVYYTNGFMATYYIPSTYTRCMDYVTQHHPRLLIDLEEGWDLRDFEPTIYSDDSNKVAYEYVLQYTDNPEAMAEDEAILFGYKDYSGYYDSGYTRFQYVGDIYSEYQSEYRFIEVYVDMTKIQ